jgi:hypothetical protein
MDRLFVPILLLTVTLAIGSLMFFVYWEQSYINGLRSECREKSGILVSYGNDYFCMPAPQSIPLKGTTK